MKRNVGGLDRMARLFGGAGVLLGGYAIKSKLMMVLGGFILATGILSKCSIYDVVGISTLDEETTGEES